MNKINLFIVVLLGCAVIFMLGFSAGTTVEEKQAKEMIVRCALDAQMQYQLASPNDQPEPYEVERYKWNRILEYYNMNK